MHEWSLLIFTTIVPAVVGGTLFLWFLSTKLLKDKENFQELLKTPLLVMAGLSLVGLVASFTHLGSPTSAIYMIMGFGRSWMSNEIVFAGAFIGLIVLLALMAVLKKKIPPAFLLVTGIIGLVAIFSMSTIYTVTPVSGWDHLNTYVIFFSTAAVLGPILVASILAPKLDSELSKSMIKQAFLISVVGIAAQFIGFAMFSVSIQEVSVIAGQTVASQLAPYAGMIGVRWFIQLLAIGVIGYLAFGRKLKMNYALAYSALLVVVVAEGMSRYVFYVLGS